MDRLSLEIYLLLLSSLVCFYAWLYYSLYESVPRLSSTEYRASADPRLDLRWMPVSLSFFRLSGVPSDL